MNIKIYFLYLHHVSNVANFKLYDMRGFDSWLLQQADDYFGGEDEEEEEYDNDYEEEDDYYEGDDFSDIVLDNNE